MTEFPDVPLFSEPPSVVSQLRSWVQANAGISFSDEQASLFGDRVRTLCDELGITAPELCGRVLSGDRRLGHKLADAASTNYSYFFREPDALQFFRDHTLQDFAHEPQIRVWSAAAATGDEAYSLAITAHEALGEAAQRYVRILGSDISLRALKVAEQGVYPVEQLAEVEPGRRARYFRSVTPSRFAVDAALRDMCTFRRLNLLQRPWPFENRFHAIFLRNILYYFDEPVRREVLEHCYDAIEPGGYLFTSLTEPLMDVHTRWVQVRPAIYRRGAR
jgi:chemotaxis protein methyltransferase CheR